MTTSQFFLGDDGPTIQRLLQAPVYLPADHVRQNVLPTIAVTIVVVTCVYLVAFPMAANKLFPAVTTDNDKGEDDDKKSRAELDDQRRRLAYQITNGVTNTLLGLLGLYFQYVVLPQKDAAATAATAAEHKIQGHEDDLYFLGAVQIGFQIWSIVMGVMWVPESTEMLVHHIAVILASSKSVFFTNGFRWYAPVALGMTELSSVPLSVMNSFKNHAPWRDGHPQMYLASRLIFSFAFLIIRIGIFVPQHLEYLRYSFLVTYWAGGDISNHVGYAYRLYMAIAWLGSVFLLVLQLYWAWLIVNGLSKFALGQLQIKSKVLETKKTN